MSKTVQIYFHKVVKWKHKVLKGINKLLKAKPATNHTSSVVSFPPVLAAVLWVVCSCSIWSVRSPYGWQQQGLRRCVSAQMARKRLEPHEASDRSLRGLFLLWHWLRLRIVQVICLACKCLWEQLCKFFGWGPSCQNHFLRTVKYFNMDRAKLLLPLLEMTDNDFSK